jgi:hypothetical protein
MNVWKACLIVGLVYLARKVVNHMEEAEVEVKE